MRKTCWQFSEIACATCLSAQQGAFLERVPLGDKITCNRCSQTSQIVRTGNHYTDDEGGWVWEILIPEGWLHSKDSRVLEANAAYLSRLKLDADMHQQQQALMKSEFLSKWDLSEDDWKIISEILTDAHWSGGASVEDLKEYYPEWPQEKIHEAYVAYWGE
jgi:hypothetical protein